MKTQSEINQLMLEFDILEEMENSFKAILENHTSEDLDIENKNISIASEKIGYAITEFGYHKFQAKILCERKIEIGCFALVISKSNERIDEFFVIYS
jgi:hypothetical protein